MQNIFLLEKAANRIFALKTYRYRNITPITNWKVMEDKTKAEKYPPKVTKTALHVNTGDSWQGHDYYLWLQTDLYLSDNPREILYFDFTRLNSSENANFEALLFIDGKPYQGVDANHKEVFLKKEFLGKKVQLALKLWSGLEGGKNISQQFKQADLRELDEACDDLYYTTLMLHDTISLLDKNNETRYILEEILAKTLLLIDWSNPTSFEFYESVENANRFLNESLEKLPKETKIKVTALGHTHIDVAWLWRLKHTREKAARSFSTVLELMEKYPEYIFLQSQPQLYKYIKEDYPELYEKIKEQVANQRWEVDGAMWLEADCNLPSGESLVRQILYGKKFVKEEFNQDMHYLWLPDVFGYSWALPQILKKSGITTFMTTKISWSQFNRMPHDTFMWKGMDGTEILTHFITTPITGAQLRKTNQFYTYNGDMEADTVLGVYQGYQDKDFNHHLLLAYGYGDGGGGVNRDMLEKRRRLNKIPGLPQVIPGQAKDFFEDLHEIVEKTDHYVHTWDGELYLEYHRGTYTSQAQVKKTNRKMELSLRELEILESFSALNKQSSYPATELDELWEVLLRNQFHDIIPGTSIKEVYQDYEKEFAAVQTKITELVANLNLHDSFTIFNTAGWSRKTLITLPPQENYALEDGTLLPTVKYPDKQIALVEMSAFSQQKLKIVNKTYQQNSLVAQKLDGGIVTDFYRISWNEAGQLTSIYDLKNQREILKGLGNVFQLFEDKPLNYDSWDIDIFYQEKGKNLTASNIQLVENTSLFATVEATYFFGKSKITQQMKLYAHTQRIDFVTQVDWQERQQLLKVAFEVDIRATEATYDIQYGNVKRPTHWNTSWDLAKFEVVGHQWADLSQRDYGISLLNDCKYGYDIKESTLRLTLLKGGIHPDPTADLGLHEFTYSLFPHHEDFIAGKTVEEAWEINQPLTLLKNEILNFTPICLTSTSSLSIDALKVAVDGNGFILRCHEHTGGNQQVAFSLAEGLSWQETNLMEENLGKVEEKELHFTLKPYEIKTFRIFEN